METRVFEVGDLLDIDGQAAFVRVVEPVEGDPQWKLIVDLMPGGAR